MTTNIDREKFDQWFNANYRTKLRDHAIIDKCRLAWQAALQSQQAAAETVVVGTKTWFENGKMVVQNLTADEVYKTDTPPATPYNRDAVVVNLMRLANINKHLARDIADAAFGTPPEAA